MKKSSFFVSLGVLMPVLFIVASLVGCLEAEKLKLKVSYTLIEKADSIKNSKPDSALLIYNKIISKVKGLQIKGADSLLLAEANIGASAAYLMIGDFGKALQHDSIAEAIALKYSESSILSKVYLNKGAIRFKTGDYDDAKAWYAKARNHAAVTKDSVIISKILSNEAMILFNAGEVEKAIDGFERALRIGQRIKNEELIANNYLNLAIVYTNQSKNDSVISYLSKALSYFKILNDKVGVYSCYKSLGSFYYNNSDYSNAIANFQLALNTAIEIGEKPSIAKSYHNMSELYFRIGDMDKATSLLDKSIKLKVELGDSLSLAKGYTATGNIHYTRSDNTAALKYYKKTLAIYERKGMVDELGSAYSNIGNAYSEMHKLDSAIYCYEKAIEFHNKTGYQIGVSNAFINLGDVYRVRNDFPKSEVYFLKALSLKKQLKDEEGIMTVYKYIAYLYLDQSKSFFGERSLAKLGEAERAGKRSYNMAKQLGLKPSMQDGCQVLENIYESMGQFQEALHYSNEFNELSRSLLDKNKIEALTFAEARWNVAKEQQEIENLKNIQRYNAEIIKQKEVEARQHKIIIWALVALTLFIGVSVFAIAMYVKKRRDSLYQKQVAQITALRMQNVRNSLSPHFVFNALNNIWAIIDNRENAKKQFDNLINLIRSSLINTEKLAISLIDEINFVKSYIDLQQQMLSGDLNVYWNISTNTNLIQLVPGMVLQIPVENAIKHGLWPKKDNRILCIDIHEDVEYLHIKVSDNGSGLQEGRATTKGTGTGLKVLTSTIHILNEINLKKMSYEMQNGTSDDACVGMNVWIKIPLIYNYNL